MGNNNYKKRAMKKMSDTGDMKRDFFDKKAGISNYTHTCLVF